MSKKITVAPGWDYVDESEFTTDPEEELEILYENGSTPEELPEGPARDEYIAFLKRNNYVL